nr:hypothetical protein [Tanacetum cinerariifolium]
LLCFVHEDITFRTSDWGKVVERVLEDNSIGVIGVIGGKWFPKAPSTWWACGNKYLSSNVLNQGPRGEYSNYAYSNPENKLVVDVAAVDALEIGVTHYSMGSYNNSWIEYADVFYRKHARQLPLGIVPLSTRDAENIEYGLTQGFVQQIVERKLPAKMGLRYLLNCFRMKPLARHTVWLCGLYAKFVWQNGWAGSPTQRRALRDRVAVRLGLKKPQSVIFPEMDADVYVISNGILWDFCSFRSITDFVISRGKPYIILEHNAFEYGDIVPEHMRGYAISVLEKAALRLFVSKRNQRCAERQLAHSMGACQ